MTKKTDLLGLAKQMAEGFIGRKLEAVNRRTSTQAANIESININKLEH